MLKIIITIAAPRESTTLLALMAHSVVYKSTYHAKAKSICFLSPNQRQRKRFLWKCEQDRDTKKEQAFYRTFSQSDWCFA